MSMPRFSSARAGDHVDMGHEAWAGLLKALEEAARDYAANAAAVEREDPHDTIELSETLLQLIPSESASVGPPSSVT
jgi:hypothetical protein